MSRSIKKNKDDLEDLRRTIKEQQNTIKNLEKHIKHLKKENKQKPQKEEPEEGHDETKNCPTCSKNTIKYTQLGIKTLITCSHCNFRATISNLYG